METVVEDLEALSHEAREFAHRQSPRTEGGATLVTLSGELGAGKTAFTKAVASALGIEEVLTSPTFILEKKYAVPHAASRRIRNFTRLIHIDAYRLEMGDSLSSLGFKELMEDAGNLIFLEWPERVASALPKPAVHIRLKVLSGGSRSIGYA